MRVLVMGAAGFVGRPVLELLESRHEVTGFDVRPVDGCPHVIQGDVMDNNAVGAVVEGCDAVVNTIMAPNNSYGHGVDRPGFTINVTGVLNLLEAARVHGIKRLVHTSSGAVLEGYLPATFMAHDLYPLKARGSYGLSKLLQEELLRNYQEQYGMLIAVIRPWGIIDAERMITTDGDAVEHFSWGTIDRHDVASALVCALEAEDIGYECFHITATPGGYRKTDVAKTEKRLGWKPGVTFNEDFGDMCK